MALVEANHVCEKLPSSGLR
jgi:hypothetical protein